MKRKSRICACKLFYFLQPCCLPASIPSSLSLIFPLIKLSPSCLLPFLLPVILPHWCPSFNYLTGEGQESTSDHPHGPGGGCSLHHMLDAYPHLCHHHSPGQNPQLHTADYYLALLHHPGLHQQVAPDIIWELKALKIAKSNYI